ncbi:MAG: hypothetical protein R2699_10260 [Acidimicrobiales bacterium]|nr:hypothetical protein [Acidimicrobiales bacterium]MCB1260752.1 hypothetical protein [Acidimicrobiales bacterium]
MTAAVPTPAASRRTLTLLVAPLIAMVVANYIAGVVWAQLATENPALLITLSSQNRYLIMVSNSLEPATYYAIGFLRLVAPDPLLYLIGFWYGDRAIRWMEGRTPTVGAGIRQLEGLFGRWGYPLVLLIPNNPVCLLAGASRMRPAVFAALNVVGTIGRLLLIRLLGQAFQQPIDDFLAWVSDYRIPIMIVSALAVGFFAWNEWRRGEGQIERLLELDDELGDAPGADGPGATAEGEPRG